jgi:NAD(P)-dependent dehydrogenase (short-subunit alcohol dehydrogenase family)
MMNVFLTGGSGHLGRATIEALVRWRMNLTALARRDASARTCTPAGCGCTATPTGSPARTRR